MTTSPPTTRGAGRTRAVLSLATAAALVALAPVTAHAETLPTDEQLLARCNQADFCKFTARSLGQGFYGDEHTVGPTVNNCGGTVTRTWGWSETTGQQTSANVSASVASALWEPISVSVSATFGKTFERNSTVSDSYTQTLTPFTKAWVTRRTGAAVITGDWELHFGSRYFGHYIWYDKNYSSKVGNPSYDEINLHFRTMTPAEIRQHCPEAGSPNVTAFNAVRVVKAPQRNSRVLQWPGASQKGPVSGDGSSSS